MIGYVLMLIGLYLVGSGIWYAVTNKTAFNTMGWVMWTIPRVIGLGLIYWGWSMERTPATPTYESAPMMGGRRRRRR